MVDKKPTTNDKAETKLQEDGKTNVQIGKEILEKIKRLDQIVSGELDITTIADQSPTIVSTRTELRAVAERITGKKPQRKKYSTEIEAALSRIGFEPHRDDIDFIIEDRLMTGKDGKRKNIKLLKANNHDGWVEENIEELERKFLAFDLSPEEAKELIRVYEENLKRSSGVNLNSGEDEKRFVTKSFNHKCLASTGMALNLELFRQGIYRPADIRTEIEKIENFTIHDAYLLMLFAEYGPEEYKALFNYWKFYPWSDKQELTRQLFHNPNPHTRVLAYKYIVQTIIGKDDPQTLVEILLYQRESEADQKDLRTFAPDREVKGKALQNLIGLTVDILLENLIVGIIEEGEISEKRIETVSDCITFFEIHSEETRRAFIEKAGKILGMDLTGKLIENRERTVEKFESSRRIAEKISDPGGMPKEEMRGALDHFYARNKATVVAIETEKAIENRALISIYEKAEPDEMRLMHFQLLNVDPGSEERYGFMLKFCRDRRSLIRDAVEGSRDEQKIQKPGNARVILAFPTYEKLMRYWFTRENFNTYPEIMETLLEMFFENNATNMVNSAILLGQSIQNHPEAERIIGEILNRTFISEDDLDRPLLQIKFHEFFAELGKNMRMAIMKKLAQKVLAWETLMPKSQEPLRVVEKAGNLFVRESNLEIADREDFYGMLDFYRALERSKKEPKAEKPNPETQIEPTAELLQELNQALAAELAKIPERESVEVILENISKHRAHQMAEGERYQREVADCPTPLNNVFKKLTCKRVRAEGADGIEYEWHLTGHQEKEKERQIFTVRGRLTNEGVMTIQIWRKGKVFQTFTAENLGKLSPEFFEEIRYILVHCLWEYYGTAASKETGNKNDPANPTPPSDKQPAEPKKPEGPIETVEKPEEPQEPTGKPEEVSNNKQPVAIEPRAMEASGAEPYMTIDLRERKPQGKAAAERRIIRENQERAAEIFRNIAIPRDPEELRRLFLYEKITDNIKEDTGRKDKEGKPIYRYYPKISYLPLDPIQAYEEVKSGRRTLDTIYVREKVAHTSGVGYEMQRMELQDGRVLEIPVARHARDTARDLHELLAEAGVVEGLDLEPVEGATRITLERNGRSEKLLEAGREYFNDYPEVQIAEKEIQEEYKKEHERLREQFLQKERITIEELEAYTKSIKQLKIDLQEKFEGKLTAIKRARELALAGLREGSDSIQLAQPGNFTIERTFNQGSFVSLTKLMGQTAND